VALGIGDVDLTSGAVIVREGKGGKSRMAFFGAKSRRELVRYLRHRQDTTPDAPLWTTSGGTRLTYSGLRQIVRRRAEKAGVDTLSLHSFRRAFALYALRNGAHIYSLQRLMGHSDLTVLRRYLKQTEADLQEAHRRAGSVDSLL
jgi:site-specific recombinase XerD